MSSQLRREGVDVAQTREAFGSLQDLQARYGELATDAALAAGGALPPPAGTAVDGAALARSLWKGNWSDALFDAIGFVPVLGDGAKAGRLANKLHDLRRLVTAGQQAVNRAFAATRRAAARHWDAVRQANRARYEEAIRSCTTKACRESAANLKGPQYGNTPRSGDRGEWVGERGDSVWQPSNGGPPIRYENGFPDYSAHSVHNVDIAMRGNRTSDFRAADNAVRDRLGDPDWEMPRGYTWHHHEDGVTMQLVPQSVHGTGAGASTPHMGGATLYDGSQAGEF